MEIKDLEPKAVFEIFDQITRIPRPSKKEDKIRAFLLDFAKTHGLEAKTDKVGNVAIFCPATPGHENAPRVILQGHMDMVCESNDKTFDFTTQPIPAYVDGEWVKTRGTTLGADNGIGMAGALAVITDKSFEHGPIQALFTTDEETGLTGAFGIEKDMLDCDILINLDSEDDAELYVGCAGGVDTQAFFSYKRSFAPADFQYFRIAVSGLNGGHSGGDIHLGRANANKIIARFLFDLTADTEVVICEIDGGNLRNAIPRAAHVVVGIHSAKKEHIRARLNHYIADLENEYAGLEPDLKLVMETAEKPEYAIDQQTSLAIIRAIYACPHGVISMSRELENLVETSTNLASVKMEGDNQIVVTTSQRSSVESRKWDIARQVEAVFLLAGAEVKHGDGYPGWQPNLNSRVLKVASEAYEELYGVRPAVKAIHAGLECGLFLSKYPGIDMVSFGPTLRDVHSPSERMFIPAVERFYGQLKRTLEKLA